MHTVAHSSPSLVRGGSRAQHSSTFKRAAHSRQVFRLHASNRKDDVQGSLPDSTNSQTLDALDSLLGVSQPDEQEEKPTRPWWATPPNQTAPPRRLAMSPGNHGKFITDEIFASDLSVGAATQLGSAVDVPKVAPVLAYLLAASSLLTSGFGAFILQSQGQEAASEYMGGLAASLSAVQGGEWWVPATSLLLFSGTADALLGAALMLLVAAEAEAVLGHRSFLAVYILGGLTACEVALLEMGEGAAVAAGAGAAVAAAAAMAGCYVRNPKQLGGARVLALLGAGLLGAGALAVGVGGCLPLIDTKVACGSWSLAAAALAGGWLGYSTGPKLEVVTELNIPDGSMVVPEDAEEVSVVVDQSAGYKKLAAAAAYALALAATAPLVLLV